MEKKCNVDGCERNHYAKGLCMMHYQRKRLYGNVGHVRPSVYRKKRSDSIIKGNKKDGYTIFVSENADGSGELKHRLKGEFIKYTDRGLFRCEDGNLWMQNGAGRFRIVHFNDFNKVAKIFDTGIDYRGQASVYDSQPLSKYYYKY